VQLEDNKVSESLQICIMALAIAESQGKGQEDGRCSLMQLQIHRDEVELGGTSPVPRGVVRQTGCEHYTETYAVCCSAVDCKDAYDPCRIENTVAARS
jgi:hypothetical protein